MAAQEIESWDDDADLDVGDFNVRTSLGSTTTNASAAHSTRRESVSSRLSTRSDQDSNAGMDDDWQIPLRGEDESSMIDAIASAQNAGIPISKSVPPSALMGGVIKRLGSRKPKRAMGEDWSEDFLSEDAEDPGLKIRQYGSANSLKQDNKNSGKSDADSERPTTDDTNREFERRLGPPAPIGPSQAEIRAKKESDDLEDDLEWPDDGELLNLPKRKGARRAGRQQDDLDEWAEGSLGVRYGGTRREGRSTGSSMISGLSPSASSTRSPESEDEDWDGLVLPDGPLKFDEVLKQRHEGEVREDAHDAVQHQAEQAVENKDDFFSGIEIEKVGVFDPKKLTLHRNIKHTHARPASPARRTAMTLTFTNKPQPASTTRIPRPNSGHDKSQSKLEPVAESGVSVAKFRRVESRPGSHSSHSSLSNIPAPSTPSTINPIAPSTPSRRVLGSRLSRDALRNEPTTTSAQLLKMKRSMPAMRTQYSPSKASSTYQRPPSRNENNNSRGGFPTRPKTPIDRLSNEAMLANQRKQPVPFLPAGNSHAQSHHVSTKSSRNFSRSEGEPSNSQAGLRSASRQSNTARSGTPTQGRKDLAPESLAREAVARRTLTRPARRRNFGDGSELEIFDDLPTSAQTENKFTKIPIGRGAPRSLRSRLGQNNLNTAYERTETPPPSTPRSPPRQESFTPRFARDTNASRLAREQRIGASGLKNESAVPSTPLSKAAGNAVADPKHGRGRRRQVGGVHPKGLIKPSDEYTIERTEKGMHYNPTLFRWEGNENALAPFEAPISPPQSTILKEGPRPALITKISTTQGVQVVGGMVFDPQRMCWLKMAPSSNPLSPSIDEEDEDPFAGIEDLKESKRTSSKFRVEDATAEGQAPGGTAPEGLGDEWLVGEEFDVGPAFVTRQRDEEERWRRKVLPWVGREREDEGIEYVWALRDMVLSSLVVPR
ncbi:MAG: hypothetical protein M1819_001538 [Sarea resinae]|nr:MAG: hypothetical protein M1819_001538 [Sarea resinae]